MWSCKKARAHKNGLTIRLLAKPQPVYDRPTIIQHEGRCWTENKPHEHKDFAKTKNFYQVHNEILQLRLWYTIKKLTVFNKNKL